MYKLEMDLRANDGKVVSISESGGHVEILVEDADIETTIKLSYEQWNDLEESLREQWGYKTFENISDK
ncbi:hypothetical protein [Clostridium sp.]|uniref:hypothetical protein n=1 Tax=Clostridium sp. TaxID=1506 RepID=UPI003216F8C7